MSHPSKLLLHVALLWVQTATFPSIPPARLSPERCICIPPLNEPPLPLLPRHPFSSLNCHLAARSNKSQTEIVSLDPFYFCTAFVRGGEPNRSSRYLPQGNCDGQTMQSSQRAVTSWPSLVLRLIIGCTANQSSNISHHFRGSAYPSVSFNLFHSYRTVVSAIHMPWTHTRIV